MGLGWSGEWASDFTQPEPKRTRVQAGLALTHLKLHPGERIRTQHTLLANRLPLRPDRQVESTASLNQAGASCAALSQLPVTAWPTWIRLTRRR
jgi:hypothetical protein